MDYRNLFSSLSLSYNSFFCQSIFQIYSTLEYYPICYIGLLIFLLYQNLEMKKSLKLLWPEELLEIEKHRETWGIFQYWAIKRYFESFKILIVFVCKKNCLIGLQNKYHFYCIYTKLWRIGVPTRGSSLRWLSKLWYHFYQDYYQKMISVSINSVLFFYPRKIQVFYRPNDMNHLSNSAGLWFSQAKL